MIERQRTLTLETLPDVMPIFPLPNAVLLPGGHLPLNIFEPRYLNMVEDALRGERIIGMIQPVAERDETLLADEVEIYDIGCAGKIVQFSETGDGRYMIVLEGLIRFKVLEELSLEDGYRRVRAEFTQFADDMNDTSELDQIDDREKLLSAMARYFDIKGITADQDAIEESSDQALVTTLSMSCPLGPGEKQALLECTTTSKRSELLTNLLEIAAFETDSQGTDIRQ